MFLTGIDVIQYSKVANQNRCRVRFMVYDDAGYIYIYHSLRLKLNYEKCHIFADTPELLRRVDLSGNPNLASIKTTHEGVIVLGAAISKRADFHAQHIRSVIQEAAPTL